MWINDTCIHDIKTFQWKVFIVPIWTDWTVMNEENIALVLRDTNSFQGAMKIHLSDTFIG